MKVVMAIALASVQAASAIVPSQGGADGALNSALFLDCTVKDATPPTVKSAFASGAISKLYVYTPSASSIDPWTTKVVDRSDIFKGYQVAGGKVSADGKNQPLIRFHSLLPSDDRAMIVLGQRVGGFAQYTVFIVSGAFDGQGKLGPVDVKTKPSFGGICTGTWGASAEASFKLAVQ